MGGEVLGFNLWVAMPFPLAALGAFAFFARRFSASASALGSIAFAVCGPLVSTGNFPNLSWSVAALPLGAVGDRRRRLGANAAAAGCARDHRRAAGLCRGAGHAVRNAPPRAWLRTGRWRAERGPHAESGMRHAVAVATGAGLGVAIAAIQLIPMAHAAAAAERVQTVSPDLWSLRPTALLETLWLHLFGNSSDAICPAGPVDAVDVHRAGAVLLHLFRVAAPGAGRVRVAGTGARRWRLFWVAAGFVSLIAAFGAYTPVYPISVTTSPSSGRSGFRSGTWSPPP